MDNMIYPLQGFYERAVEVTKPPVIYTNPDFQRLNTDVLKQAIPNISNIDDHSLSILIKNGMDTLISDIMQGAREYSNLFKDSRFVSLFIKVLYTIPIDYKTILVCNKITYDYFTSDNADGEIKKQFLDMSKFVNRENINRLMSIGLDETTAVNLSLARHSSTNERTNVKRLNFAIYHRNPEIMNEQMVVWIYEKLFKRISDLFQATMFEVYHPNQMNEFGENFSEVYGVVGLAVLIILNNMTSENIRKVLVGYHNDWEFLGKPPVRFSLRALSGDYSRITNVVEYLDSIGIYIP